MSSVETIVVGGGVGGVAPFALNGVPFVTNTDPSSISTTDFLSVVPTGVNRGLIVGLADPNAAATERLRVKGGAILEGTVADSTVIGRGASASAAASVAIGRLATLTGVGVVIGSASSMSGSGGVVIEGTSSMVGGSPQVVIVGTLSGAAGQPVVIGGTSITGLGVCVVGGGAAITASNATAFGFAAAVGSQGGVAIGAGATVAGGGAFTNSIAIGNGAGAFAVGQLCIGSNASGQGINTVVIGHGLDTTATPTGVTIRLTNASGLNAPAGNLVLRPGVSTGSAVAGDFQVASGVPGGSSSTLQNVTTRLAVRSSVTALDTWLMIFDVDNGVLERVSVGIADSGGAGFKLLRIPN